jgi:hypothetical protein
MGHLLLPDINGSLRIFCDHPVQLFGMITLVFLLPFFAVFLLFFPSRPNGPYWSVRLLMPTWELENRNCSNFDKVKRNEQWLRLLVAVWKVYFSYWQIEHITFQTVWFPFPSQTRARVFLVLRKMIIYHLTLRSRVKAETSLPDRFFEGKFSLNSGIKIKFNILLKHFHL